MTAVRIPTLLAAARLAGGPAGAQSREGGHRLHGVQHHGDLLADASLVADRAQSHPGWIGDHRRAGGGLTVYRDDGALVYEYNMMIIETYPARTARIPAGRHEIVVDTVIAKPGAPAEVTITVDGREAARTSVGRTVPAAFTATETFDVGVDLGSPVSVHYADRRPFAFDGRIAEIRVSQ